eukprot:scaffold66997_cov54-Phaeocystis_antarctica.AAC.2
MTVAAVAVAVARLRPLRNPVAITVSNRHVDEAGVGRMGGGERGVGVAGVGGLGVVLEPTLGVVHTPLGVVLEPTLVAFLALVLDVALRGIGGVRGLSDGGIAKVRGTVLLGGAIVCRHHGVRPLVPDHALGKLVQRMLLRRRPSSHDRNRLLLRQRTLCRNGALRLRRRQHAVGLIPLVDSAARFFRLGVRLGGETQVEVFRPGGRLVRPHDLPAAVALHGPVHLLRRVRSLPHGVRFRELLSLDLGGGGGGALCKLLVVELLHLARFRVREVDEEWWRDALALAQIAWAGRKGRVAVLGTPGALDVRPKADALNGLVARAHVVRAVRVRQVAAHLAPIVEVEAQIAAAAHTVAARQAVGLHLRLHHIFLLHACLLLLLLQPITQRQKRRRHRRRWCWWHRWWRQW